jgi:hypothetical protein
MQNEPNLFRHVRITSAVMTGRYDKIIVLWMQKNEPKRTQTYTVWAIWAIYVSFEMNISCKSCYPVKRFAPRRLPGVQPKTKLIEIELLADIW